MRDVISLGRLAKCSSASSTPWINLAKSAKNLRCVARFLIFFQRNSIGLKSGD